MAAQPLLGRDRELAVVVAAIDGDRSTVISGEAGIGKTALARGAVAASGRPLREGGAFSTLDWVPYLALRRAADQWLSGDPVSVAAHVERLVGPDVLFVDDLQWADEQTLETVQLLVGRLALIVTVRSLSPGAEGVSARLAAAGAGEVSLPPLSDVASRTLVERAAPDLRDAVVDDLVRRAAGNPLLLEELVQSGQAPGVLARALSGRIDELPTSERAVVELLAIADRPVARKHLGRGVGRLVREGIALDRGGQIELRHALIAAAIRERLGAEERQRVHARAARLPGEPGEVARHLAASGHSAEASQVALAALSETTDARERAALLVVAAEATPASRGVALRLDAARALDEVAEWEVVSRVLGPAVADGAPDQRVEAEAILAHAAFAVGDVAGCRDHLAAAGSIGAVAGSPGDTRLAIETATYLINVEGAVEPALAALSAASSASNLDPAAAEDLDVLTRCIVFLTSGQGDLAVIQAAADAAFAARRFRTATDRARVVHYVLHMAVGAEAALAYLLERHGRYHDAGAEWIALEFLSDATQAAFLSGRLAETVAIADRLLEQPAPPRPRRSAEIFRARALAALGHLEDGERALQALLPIVSPDFFGRGDTLTGLAEVALWGGRPDVAVDRANDALAVTPPVPVAHVQALLIRAWARHELGLPTDTVLDMGLTPSVAGASVELGALAALEAEDFAAAADGFTAAAGAWQAFHVERALICRWASADARRRQGLRDGVADDLRVTLEATTGGGFAFVSARARRSLRLLGVRIAATPDRAARPGLLTPRERELVRLVEHGLTNLEIARRLGLGQPTVARILASAMGKVGVDRRAGLVGAADAGQAPGVV